MQKAEETPQQLYKRLATAIAAVSDGWIGSNAETVILRLSQRDVVAKKNRNFLSTFLKGSEGHYAPVGFPAETAGDVMVSPSPSGKLLAYFRPVPSDKKDDRPKAFIEIWDKSPRLIQSIPTEGKHGAFYGDDWFKGLSWSSDETRIVYMAEPIPPKTESLLENEEQLSSLSPSLGHYEWKEDWGETYVNKRMPRAFIVDLRSEKIGMLGDKGLIPDTLTVGQPEFAPGDNEIVLVGWDITPRRLGIVYCYQRPCALYAVTAPSEIKEDYKPPTNNNNNNKTTTPSPSPADTIPAPAPEGTFRLLAGSKGTARSPRFSPDGKSLLYLASDDVTTHGSCFRLCVLPWGTTGGESRTVIEVVEVPSGPSDFPGLFLHSLPNRCWLDDSRHVVLSSSWRTSNALLLIDTTTGTIRRLSPAVSALPPVGMPLDVPVPPAERDLAWNLLDIKGRHLLTIVSGPTVSPRVLLGTVSNDNTVESWTTVRAADLTLPFHVSLLTLRPSAPPPSPLPDWSGDYEALLLSPPNVQRPPLIAFPHGGPHGGFTGDYATALSFLVLQGYAVLLVNFRGSTGFGKWQLESLPGHCGTNDVQDVQQSVEAVLARGLGDKDRVVVTGGSHGGFLGLHMVGQYPNVYKACAVRNPVTDISVMRSVTDIPDWCYVEAGIDLSHSSDPSTPLTGEHVAKMYNASPAAHAHRIKSPVLMLIGAMDRRVPPSQGWSFYHLLKAYGVKTRMQWYPESVHSIGEVDPEADAWINIALWFKDSLTSSSPSPSPSDPK